jgi:hypothetical protein
VVLLARQRLGPGRQPGLTQGRNAEETPSNLPANRSASRGLSATDHSGRVRSVDRSSAWDSACLGLVLTTTVCPSAHAGAWIAINARRHLFVASDPSSVDLEPSASNRALPAISAGTPEPIRRSAPSLSDSDDRMVASTRAARGSSDEVLRPVVASTTPCLRSTHRTLQSGLAVPSVPSRSHDARHLDCRRGDRPDPTPSRVPEPSGTPFRRSRFSGAGLLARSRRTSSKRMRGKGSRTISTSTGLSAAFPRNPQLT